MTAAGGKRTLSRDAIEPSAGAQILPGFARQHGMERDERAVVSGSWHVLASEGFQCEPTSQPRGGTRTASSVDPTARRPRD